MNRIIKFRAWDKRYKVMYQPDDIAEIPNDVDKEIEYLLSLEDGARESLSRPMGDIELLQFTGMKDKNGVEVYDGDLVRLTFSENCVETVKVIFDDYGAFAFADLDDETNKGLNHTGFSFSRVSHYGDVVGHVFEKGKLLEEIFRNEFRHKSDRVYKIMSGLQMGGCPLEEIENAVVARLIETGEIDENTVY